MRKIELMMVEAIKAGKPMKSGNTKVVWNGFDCTVYLYGNAIARVTDILDPKCQWQWSLADHNTRATRSRINALSTGLGWGFKVFNLKGIPTVIYGAGPRKGNFRARPFQISDTEWVEA